MASELYEQIDLKAQKTKTKQQQKNHIEKSGQKILVENQNPQENGEKRKGKERRG